MSTPKWFLIAKNQYRIYTSSIRVIRPYFPLLVIAALALFVWYGAPNLVGLFVDELIAFFLSQVAVVVVPVMLFMFFFVFMMLPITYALRDIKTEQQWLFLSAPIKSSDILLGEFLGELPLYGILIVVVVGVFTAILTPLGIDVLQKTIIVLVFLVTLSSALWIGTVIAALLRTRLGKSARGRDMGKALSVLIVLPMVALLYAFIGGGVLEALADPGTSGIVKTVLSIFPSSWGAEIINGFASNPGNTGAVASGTVYRLGGLLAFFVGVLWAGVRVADRAYSVEATTFTASKAKPDGVLYKTVKYLGGGQSFGTLLASTFKVYTRRLHNISWLVYVVCLVALLNIFFIKADSPMSAVIMSSFVFSLLAAIVASDVTIRGKETLFIYKKVPSGIGTLLKTRLIQGWLVVIPLVVILMTIIIVRIPQVSLGSMLAHIGLVVLIAAAYTVFALGLFLLMPAYSEKGGEFMLNIMIVVQGSIFLFLGCLLIFGEIEGLLLMVLLSWLLGIALFFAGKRHLSRME